MDNRIPAPLRNQLADYVSLLEKELPEFLSGLYLHGSIALNAFNPHLSDIDFIALTSRPASESDVVSLAAIHQKIKTAYPRWAQEGSYLQWEDLGKLEESATPCPFYHDGILTNSGIFDINSVTWWVLKHHGITLMGPPAQSLALDTDWNLLVCKMKQNLNSYWASFTRNPQRIAWLFSDFGIEWVVLGVLRQYYTFMEHGITSKIGAGEYALTHLPAKWHRLIHEAIRIREQVSSPLYTSRAIRALQSYNFVKYIIHTSNALPRVGS